MQTLVKNNRMITFKPYVKNDSYYGMITETTNPKDIRVVVRDSAESVDRDITLVDARNLYSLRKKQGWQKVK
jgi:hypothetical protein